MTCRKTSIAARFLHLFLWCILAPSATAKNGFDLSGILIPADEVLQGGPPRDGIPSIDAPQFIDAAAADFLSDEDEVLGVSIDDIARAYPIRILNWHEIVNDRIGERYFAVTFCPLCGSGVVFDSTVSGRKLAFGVSGLLYNSDVLLYDRETESLWSQLQRRAVSGEYTGVPLTTLPVEHTTWKHWREQHPHTQALAIPENFQRDYARDPYKGYDKTPDTFFPAVPQAPDEFFPKEPVLGVVINGIAKAYPFSELKKQGKKEFKDTVGGRAITIYWNEAALSARAGERGDADAAVRAFWFAWFAFHPQTEIFRAP